MEGGPKGAELRRFGPLKKKRKKKDASIRGTQSQNYKTKLQTLSFSEGVLLCILRPGCWVT